ncbi:hypothetical protein Btru_015335 [Bulinus truncatus]|nr:hypothetical protein Btru_015335 [Bulinus truncatus]
MKTNFGVVILTHAVVTMGSLAFAQTSVSAFKTVQSVGAVCTTVKEFTARHRISCTTACGQSKLCYGVRWSSGKTCELLYHDCFSGAAGYNYNNTTWSPGGQTTSSANETIYRKSVTTCQNNGVWVNATFGCACVDCWVGYYCDRYPKNCSELFTYGYPKVTIQCTLDTAEDGQLLAKTTCKIFTSGVALTVIAMTNDTGNAHNRTWGEYEGGFWNSSRDFFVGLKQIVALNARQGLTTVRTQVDFAAPKGNWTWVRENVNFLIQNRSYG